MANLNASTANVQNPSNDAWKQFCEKAKKKLFVVPLVLKPNQVLTFVSFDEKKVKNGEKTILVLVTDDGTEVPLFLLPQVGKDIQNGKFKEFKTFSVRITSSHTNEKGYTSYLCIYCDE